MRTPLRLSPVNLVYYVRDLSVTAIRTDTANSKRWRPGSRAEDFDPLGVAMGKWSDRANRLQWSP